MKSTKTKTYKCTKCKETKPYYDFYNNISKPSGKDNICKDCRSELNIAQKPYRKSIIARRKLILDEIRAKGCVICGSKDNLHFHHIWPWAKNIRITAHTPYCDELWNSELATTSCICARCHMKVHSVLKGYKNIKDERIYEYIDCYLRRGGK